VHDGVTPDLDKCHSVKPVFRYLIGYQQFKEQLQPLFIGNVKHHHLKIQWLQFNSFHDSLTAPTALGTFTD
jgi:hypothetical protein